MDTTKDKSALQIVDGCPHDIFNITPIPTRADDLFIRINRSGYVTCTPPSFLIQRPDSYRYSVLHCVVRGRGGFTAGGETHSVQQGQLFLLGPYASHTYWSDASEPMGLIWVEFLGGNSERMTRYILDTCGGVFEGEVFDPITKLCTSLVAHPNRHTTELSMELYQVLSVLCRHCGDEQERQDPVQRQILEYVELHLETDLSLAALSKQFGYNPAYFSDRFSRAAGMTFTKYVLHRRISRACFLLMTTDWPLSRIGHSLGFYDVSHFIQRFKASEGTTPAKYRMESLGLAHCSSETPDL